MRYNHKKSEVISRSHYQYLICMHEDNLTSTNMFKREFKILKHWLWLHPALVVIFLFHAPPCTFFEEYCGRSFSLQSRLPRTLFLHACFLCLGSYYCSVSAASFTNILLSVANVSLMITIYY